MKIIRLLLIIVAVSVIAVVVAHRVRAQSADSEDRGVLGQYEQLVLSLSKHGDSNTVSQVTSLVSGMEKGHAATDIVITIHVLESLRSGRTNEAVRFLEGRLDSALMFFGAPPQGSHDPKYDKILKMAEQYRSKYPYKEGVPEIDATVQKALDSVPK